MGIGTGLLIGSLALATVSAGAQMFMSSQQAAAQVDAAQQQFEFHDAELTRQQTEINRIAEEDKSDITRRVEHELGAIRAAAGELGASGNTSYIRMLAELGAVEGIDLSRIESNRTGAITSAQSSKRAASISGQNVVQYAQKRQTAKTVDSVLGFVGTGLQIGTNHHRRQEELERLKNTTGE